MNKASVATITRNPVRAITLSLNQGLYQAANVKAKGFTLLEVLLAITIMAIIAAMTSITLPTAITSSQSIQEALDRVSKVDRVWVLFETDIRNVIASIPKVAGASQIPPVFVDPSEEYRFTLLRGGYANPLRLPRTEVVRVGYRFEDNVLWRDTWTNIADNDERNATPRKVLEDIEEIVIRVLASDGRSTVSGGPWLERWPRGGQPPQTLPAAVEITLQLEDFGEIKRLYSILPGIDNSLVDAAEATSSSSSSTGSNSRIRNN